jgi:hypothetical protein
MLNLTPDEITLIFSALNLLERNPRASLVRANTAEFAERSAEILLDPELSDERKDELMDKLHKQKLAEALDVTTTRRKVEEENENIILLKAKLIGEKRRGEHEIAEGLWKDLIKDGVNMVEQDMADEFNIKATSDEQHLFEQGVEAGPDGKVVRVDTAWAMGIDKGSEV